MSNSVNVLEDRFMVKSDVHVKLFFYLKTKITALNTWQMWKLFSYVKDKTKYCVAQVHK